MLWVLWHGSGCISQYGRCGCAKKKRKKKEQKIRKENREWLMTNVVGAVAGSRVRRCGCAKKKKIYKKIKKKIWDG
jgi:hypothetical protein